MSELFSHIDVQTRMTQNYWSAEPFQPVRGLHLMNSSGGRSYLAEIAEDGHLWMCLPNDGSETGTELKKYPITVTIAHLTCDKKEAMMLLGATANFLYLICEERGRPGEPVEIIMNLPVGASRMMQLRY